MTDTFASWKPTKVTWLFELIGSGTTPDSNNANYYADNGTPWLLTGDLTDGPVYRTTKFVTADAMRKYSSLTVYPPGSLVVAMYGATIGKLGLLQVESTTNQACCVLAKPTNCDPRFVYYWFVANRQNIISAATGGGQPNISQELVRSLRIPSPPLPVQNRISGFLSRKTSQLDKLISKKQRMIELLAEERQAIINEAVTKGINPNVKLKASGIEWIGDVPDHWQIQQLRYLLRSVTGGGTPSTDNPSFWDGEIPWVSAKDMKTDVLFDSQDHITVEGMNASPARLIPRGAVLIVTRSGILKHTVPVAINAVDVTVNQDIKALRCADGLTEEYLFYTLKGLSNAILFYCSKLGATVDSLEMEDVLHFQIPIPPVQEQRMACAVLKERLERLDALVESAERQIGLLQEYRTALITEAVTGKLDIPAFV